MELSPREKAIESARLSRVTTTAKTLFLEDVYGRGMTIETVGNMRTASPNDGVVAIEFTDGARLILNSGQVSQLVDFIRRNA